MSISISSQLLTLQQVSIFLYCYFPSDHLPIPQRRELLSAIFFFPPNERDALKGNALSKELRMTEVMVCAVLEVKKCANISRF